MIIYLFKIKDAKIVPQDLKLNNKWLDIGEANIQISIKHADIVIKYSKQEDHTIVIFYFVIRTLIYQKNKCFLVFRRKKCYIRILLDIIVLKNNYP